MKELLFLRHAKSSWEHGVNDRNRPLQPKGIRAISVVAQHDKSRFQSFECILSSPANRAFHTAAILVHEIGFPWHNFHLNEALYSFDCENIIAVVHALKSEWDKVILVGHNPAFSAAADYFSASSAPELKTADWIQLKFTQDSWREVTNGDLIYRSKKEAQKQW